MRKHSKSIGTSDQLVGEYGSSFDTRARRARRRASRTALRRGRRREVLAYAACRHGAALLEEDSLMADESAMPTSQWTRASLYQEETFTDRRVGHAAAPDAGTRPRARGHCPPVLYVGQTQVLTPAGALPLSFEVPPRRSTMPSRSSARRAKQALARTMRRLEELRREQASSIIVPGSGAVPGVPGGRGLR